MRTLTASQILDVWDRGRSANAVERALILLAAATNDSWERLAALPIGRRDSWLLELRAAIFGAPMDGIVTCRACNERLDLTLDVDELLAGAARESPEKLLIDVESYQVEARLPTSADLLAIMSQVAERQQLIERCVVGARQEGVELPASLLPERIVTVIAERLAEVDPLAQIELELRCPACDHRWALLFDIGAFLWAEIDSLAQRTLHEVHALATAYGWHESDILGMSPWRRRAYLELAQS
jgi:hypothetical protein